MAQSHSTASPEAAKASSASHPPVPVIQTAPEHEASATSTFGQRVVSAIGGGNPETPPHRFGSMLGNMPGSSSMQAGVLRQLQRSYGNSYVRNVIQAKLTVNQPGDIYEQEADRVAEQVMLMPDIEVSGVSNASAQIQRKCAACASDQSLCPECEEEEMIQRKPLASTITPLVQRRTQQQHGKTPEVNSKTAANIHAMRGNGQPLADTSRAFFERRFGYDFSQVRVHADTSASETARSLNARAFTFRNDVAFEAGQFSPETREGKKLLAHELAHTIQQSSLGSDTALQRAPAGRSNMPTKALEPLEAIANRIAQLALGPHQAAIPGLFRGPVISVVRDTESGKVFVGLNTGIPEDLTQLMKEAIEAQRVRISSGEVNVIHTIEPGTHSEVNALNQAIAAREQRIGGKVTEDMLKTFELHNVWLREGGPQLTPAPRCEHCARITRSVSVTRSMFIGEGGKVGEVTVPQRGQVVPSGGPTRQVTNASGEIITPASLTTTAGVEGGQPASGFKGAISRFGKWLVGSLKTVGKSRAGKWLGRGFKSVGRFFKPLGSFFKSVGRSVVKSFPVLSNVADLADALLTIHAAKAQVEELKGEMDKMWAEVYAIIAELDAMSDNASTDITDTPTVTPETPAYPEPPERVELTQSIQVYKISKGRLTVRELEVSDEVLRSSYKRISFKSLTDLDEGIYDFRLDPIDCKGVRKGGIRIMGIPPTSHRMHDFDGYAERGNYDQLEALSRTQVGLFSVSCFLKALFTPVTEEEPLRPDGDRVTVQLEWIDDSDSEKSIIATCEGQDPDGNWACSAEGDFESLRLVTEDAETLPDYHLNVDFSRVTGGQTMNWSFSVDRWIDYPDYPEHEVPFQEGELPEGACDASRYPGSVLGYVLWHYAHDCH